MGPDTTNAVSLGPQQQEKDRLLAAIKTTKGNRKVADRLLGISRATFYR
ncbi:MAG: helix-turn-helix domain-containing protein [Planctomycetota bacterium]|jgi:transcriptional regulator of acetoin/glycerol metabolism